MTSVSDAELLAERLRAQLTSELPSLTQEQALGLVAKSLGYEDWDAFVAAEDTSPLVVPVLRTFPGIEAERFYLDFLGFCLDWEHRFEPGMPLYRQVCREGVVLHLSEHHGDATPGSTVRVRVPDVARLQRELAASDVYPLKIGLSHEDWGDELAVPDPFGNTLILHTPSAEGAGLDG